MNAIKNTIVTVTLLAVGFGAYTVLQNPPQHSLDDNELTWDASNDLVDAEAPVTSLPDANTLVTAGGPSPSFLDQISAPRTTTDDTESFDAPDMVEMAGSAPGESYASDADASSDAYGSNDSVPYEDNSDVDTDVYSTDTASTAVNPYADGENADRPSSLTSRSNTSDAANPTDNAPSYYDTVANPGEAADVPPSESNGDVGVATPSDAGAQANSSSVPTESEFENTMNYVQMQLQEDQLGEALLTLSQSYRSELNQDQAERVSTLIDQLAGTVIYSPRSYLQPAHQVTADETLQSIARQYQVPVDFIARVNGLENDYQPVAGETLKVVQGPFRATLYADTGELIVYLGEYYAGRFRVELGSDAPRVGGEFEVIEKSNGREFFDRRSGYRIAKDDPANPYGNRWIGLRGEQITAGHNVGIHVANEADPGSGCFRVNQVNAEDLSAILSIGSRVTFLR